MTDKHDKQDKYMHIFDQLKMEIALAITTLAVNILHKTPQVIRVPSQHKIFV